MATFPTIYLFAVKTDLKEEFEACNPRLDVVFIPIKWRVPPDLSGFDVDKIEVVIGLHWIFARVYEQCPNLRWFHSGTAGNDKMFQYVKNLKNVPSCIYTRSSSVNAEFVSQYIITQILANEKCLFQMYENHKEKLWTRDKLTSRSMSDITICILGLGSIGHKTAKLCKSFNMYICGITRTPVPEEIRASEVDEYKLREDLHELLERCDYIVNLLPSTNLTRGLFNGTVLSSCQKCPVFINVGRGDIIEEQDIIQALRKKWISKAILDVSENEPIPETSELWTEPGVFITPHVAFGLAPKSVYKQIAGEYLQNYYRYVNKRPLMNVLPFDRGY